MIRIGILVHPGVEELDFVGPLRRYPLRVEPASVVDDAVFSAAGASAGLGLGFALRKRLFGPDLARGVAKGIEYAVDMRALP